MNNDEQPAVNRGVPDHFFSDPALDRMMAVLFNLASEAWVQEERLRALEGRIDKNPEVVAKLFIDRIFAPLREI